MMENHSRLIIGLLKLHHGVNWVIIMAFFLFAPYITAQNETVPPPAPVGYALDPTIKVSLPMAILLVCLLSIFLFLGCFSVYIRQIIERRFHRNFPSAVEGGGRWQREEAGRLDPAVIDNFPTFKYSEVRGLKIGKAALECAVCLNEFEDDETLRLLPKCSHVFHPDCIDAWLATHVTCPVCRANLVPEPGELGPITILLSHDSDGEPVFADRSSEILRVANDSIIDVQSPDVINQNHPSRWTNVQTGEKFPRSHSTGHLPVQPDLNFERFTLKLPEEVRNRIMNSSLTRAKSCVVFPRAMSSRKGFRTSSVGTGRERNYFYYERFGKEGRSDRWAFTMTPSYLSRSGSSKSWFNSIKSPFDRLFGRPDKDNVGERSFDGLRRDSQV